MLSNAAIHVIRVCVQIVASLSLGDSVMVVGESTFVWFEYLLK